MLCLAGCVLIERVRHVERRPRELDIQMYRVGVARTSVQPIEERLAVAVVVQRLEFRWIEKAIGALTGEREEIADPVRARAKVDLTGRALERSVPRREAARGLPLVKSGLGGYANDQAVLVSEFGRRHARNQLERLHRLL